MSAARSRDVNADFRTMDLRSNREAASSARARVREQRAHALSALRAASPERVRAHARSGAGAGAGGASSASAGAGAAAGAGAGAGSGSGSLSSAALAASASRAASLEAALSRVTHALSAACLASPGGASPGGGGLYAVSFPAGAIGLILQATERGGVEVAELRDDAATGRPLLAKASGRVAVGDAVVAIAGRFLERHGPVSLEDVAEDFRAAARPVAVLFRRAGADE